jgi:hypothetical protein
VISFSEENMPLDFIGLPPFLQIQFIIGDMGYTFSNKIGDFFDEKCKMVLKELFILRTQVIPLHTVRH